MKWEKKEREFDAIGKKFANVEKVFIYGCGYHGTGLAKKLTYCDDITGFVDIRAAEFPDGYLGKPVYHLNEFLKLCRKNLVVIVALEDYMHIIDMLTYEGFVEDENLFDYATFPISAYYLHRCTPVIVGNTRFYVEDPQPIASLCEKDYRLDESDDEVRIINNGIILPAKRVFCTTSEGGVCDADGIFVDGHSQRASSFTPASPAELTVNAAYSVKDDIEYVPETVVYGGFLFNHFGHMIVESLSRMWWYLDNCDCGYKFVFISHSTEKDMKFFEYFKLLGMREESIVLLKEPRRFDKIIIPKQSMYYRDGYKHKAIKVYDVIRNSVKPAKHKNVYLTRTRLLRRDTINEEYFEDYYRNLGYEIIAPEQLTLTEQISIIAGANNIVCVCGSLHHHILFAQNGVNITVLNKVFRRSSVFHWINQARGAYCTFVDVHKSFLPSPQHRSCHLLMPTPHWIKYIRDCGDETVPSDVVSVDTIIEYMETWAKTIIFVIREDIEIVIHNLYKKLTLADVVKAIHDTLSAVPLDEPTKKKLYETFSHHYNSNS